MSAEEFSDGHMQKNPDGYYEISNIPAHRLGHFYQVDISGSVPTHLDPMMLSALSYGYLAMQLEPGSEKYEAVNGGDLQVLAKALYVYAKAAEELI